MKKLVCLVLIIVMNFGFVGVSYGEEKCEYVEGEKYDGVGDIEKVTYSPDGKSMSFVIRINDEEFVIKDGKKYNEYKVGNRPSLTYSHDSNHFAFISIDYNIGTTSIINDGVKREYNNKIYDFIYSPNNKDIAFITRDDKGLFVISNGDESKRYDTIKSLTYSPNGRELLFVAEKEGKFFVVKDGKEGKNYDKIGQIIFSDSNDFAYIALKEGKWFVVKNNLEEKKYEKVGNLSFKKSALGNDLFYIGEKKQLIKLEKDKIQKGYIGPTEIIGGDIYKVSTKYVIVQNGKEIKEYDTVNGFTYSEDKRFIYFFGFIDKGNNDIKISLIKDWKEIGTYDFYNRIKYLYYSPDGKSLSFIMTTENGSKVVVKDGKMTKEYLSILEDDDIRSFIYSSDSKKIAFIGVSKDKKIIVVQEGESDQYYDYDNVYGLTYSPNSEEISFIATKNGKQFIIRNGMEGKEYDEIFLTSIKYSLNSKDLMFIAKKDKKYILVRNGEEIGKYDDIERRTIYNFSKSNNFFIATRDEKVFFVKEVCTGTNQTNTISNTKPNLKTKPSLTRQYIISKSKIKKLPNGDLIIAKLDQFIDKYKNNKKTLNKIYIKLGEIRSKISDEDKLILIYYLEGKIGLEIYNVK